LIWTFFINQIFFLLSKNIFYFLLKLLLFYFILTWETSMFIYFLSTIIKDILITSTKRSFLPYSKQLFQHVPYLYNSSTETYLSMTKSQSKLLINQYSYIPSILELNYIRGIKKSIISLDGWCLCKFVQFSSRDKGYEHPTLLWPTSTTIWTDLRDNYSAITSSSSTIMNLPLYKNLQAVTLLMSYA